MSLSPELHVEVNTQAQQMFDSSATANSEPIQDPFSFTEEEVREFSNAGLISSVEAAIDKGFHVFPLLPQGKIPLPGSNGFKDSKSPSDPQVLNPWIQDPSLNIGIDLGASDLCVLDFDKPESMPEWLNQIKTYRVKTAKGVHVYFRGVRKTTKLYVDGDLVGDIKSAGGYVLSAGSRHPDGPTYTVIDGSAIAPLPDISNLIRPTSKQVNASPDGPPIPYRNHDTELTRIAGVLRNAGFSETKIEEQLVDVCEHRCEGYGTDYRQMCKKIAHSIAQKPVGQAAQPVIMGGVTLGQAQPTVEPSNWRSLFRNLSEMEQGDIVMIIDGVLQEGTCFLGANPGNGKTLVALAIAKAITLGEPLFGISEYIVKQPRNVIYLIPESADRAFRKRGEAFRLPQDDRFIARTISSGGPLALSDPALMEAVRQTKPVVILDTASRFLQANDENSAAQNRMLVNDVTALRAAGAPCVIILHHAKKSQTAKRETMTLDNMLRGTSDFGAMCDQAYGIRMDEHLYNRGAGPMEIELVNLKDRERLGGLTSVRLAASYKKAGAIFPTSYIDEAGNFRPVDYKESKARDESTLNSLVEANPMMTIAELSEATGVKPYSVKEVLKRFGWHCLKGGPDGRTPWHKDGEHGCPHKKGSKDRKTSPIALDALPVSGLVAIN